jgi:Uma2 family endonuclease
MVKFHVEYDGFEGCIVVSLTQTGLMTFAEFEKLPNPPAGHYELRHGQVVLIPPRIKSHAVVQQRLLDLLSPLVRDRGFITIELPFRPAPEYESWVADIGFVSHDRWVADQNNYFLGAPDFVIEVLSQSNTLDEILERQSACVDHGCSAFWTVDPKRRLVMVTTADRRTVTYDASTSVPIPANVAEGFIEVAAIFQ